MRDFKYIWLIALVGAVLIVAAPVLAFIRPDPADLTDPWVNVPQRLPATDHTDLIAGPYATGSEVTQTCLECHENAAEEMMQTVHWKWEGDPVLLPGREEMVTIGKKNSINNFCIRYGRNELLSLSPGWAYPQASWSCWWS
jgi:hypothetical protein